MTTDIGILCGNRCGHNPAVFRDVLFSNEKKRPKVNQWAMERIRKYFVLPEKFPELKIFNNTKKNGELRNLRSEGRESLRVVSLLLFFHFELSTMTVRTDDIYFRCPTLEKLTKKGEHISLSRAYRALRKLKKAGLITVTPQFEKSKDNLYRAFASIKEVTYKFFNVLGLGKYYSFSKSYKQKILEKRGCKIRRRQGAARSFDKFLFPQPSKSFIKRQAIGTLSPEKIQAMRKSLIEILIKRSPAVDKAMIESIVYKYDERNLKSTLESAQRLSKGQSP